MDDLKIHKNGYLGVVCTFVFTNCHKKQNRGVCEISDYFCCTEENWSQNELIDECACLLSMMKHSVLGI